MLNDKLPLSFILMSIAASVLLAQQQVAPILDIENESIGYVGKIGERNVLVDLKPHLQIKNIDEINGICSYHVFKPNSEEFPFTIDIKDKTTGEAVIEVVRKEVEATSTTTKPTFTTTEIFDVVASKNKAADPTKSILLDCNKRKEFNFLIQAHDCSVPSLASNKVPVKIEVVDHDDYRLKFDRDLYKKTLIKSDDLYENFMQVTAKDQDCTNNGLACHYKVLNYDLTEVSPDFAFKIDNSGLISTTRGLSKGELFEFTVRAFDCVTVNSFVDTKIIIDVIEQCNPQWSDFTNNINSISENTNLFEEIKTSTCNLQYQNAFIKPEFTCDIDQVNAKVTFELDPVIKSKCMANSIKCNNNVLIPSKNIPVKATATTKSVLFTVNKNKLKVNDDLDDDTIEDDNDSDENSNENGDENSIQLNGLKKPDGSSTMKLPPLNYRSFSKVTENAQKIDFDGQFGDEFTLSVWLRRPANADKSIKEQVLCGTDSHEMNRHHYGIYFYRGNFKFLLRKEPNKAKIEQQQTANQDSEVFYPSLWEWNLYEPLLSDSKWHFYEIKFSYPNASLYIDGVKFIENSTNSDIIDAYELSDVKESGPVITYVGACFHSRTSTLLDHFEGDIADLVLTKKSKDTTAPLTHEKQSTEKCKQSCNEYIEMNMVGNENYLSSIESSNQFEIAIKTPNLNDMTQLLRKVNYVNKNSNPKQGLRNVKVTSSIRCGNNGKQIQLKEVTTNINIKIQKDEFNVQMEAGVKQLFASKFELENGIEPFKDISILKIPINKIDDETGVGNDDDDDNDDDESSEEASGESAQPTPSASSNKDVLLSKCLIKIMPQRNLMAPKANSEKIMFLQNLLDEFNFKFEETINTVTISGIQSAESYETFIRRLTYLILNINEVSPANLELIKNKQFYITCFRSEPNIETNTILIQLNLTRPEIKKVNMADINNNNGFVAHKQIQKLVVSENDDDVAKSNVDDSLTSFTGKKSLSPMIIAVIVLCSCVIGFIIVFGVIKMHTMRFFNAKRKPLPNEENPQMEWDDSGLNITENPLDNLKMKKAPASAFNVNMDEYDENQQGDYDEYTSSEEEDDEEDEDDDEIESNDECDRNQAAGMYSESDEPEKVVIDRELEWDDTSLEIKVKDKQMQLEQQSKEANVNFLKSNKMTSSLSSNKFV